MSTAACLLLSIVIAAGTTSCRCERSRKNNAASNAAVKSDSTGSGTVSDLVAAVQQRIASDIRVKSKQIQIRVDNGTATLTGSVSSEDELLQAGSDAMEVPGVEGVANYLSYPEKLHDSSAHLLSADEINAAITSVQQSIRSNATIKGRIQVSFVRFSQDIRLSGKVTTEDERVAVRNAAIRVTDVSVSTSLGCVCADQKINFDAVAAPWTGSPAPAELSFPICPGLTVVTAVAQPQGDYESIKTIEAVDSKQIRLKYSTELMPPWWSNPHPQLQHIVTHRTFSFADLESTHRYNHIFTAGGKLPDTAGATAIGTSAEVLKELKTTGETEINLCGDTRQSITPDGQVLPSIGGCSSYNPMTLKRVENEPVRLRVLMNGTPVDLPAVHARSRGGAERHEFFFLDDERNPLTLSFRLGIGEITTLSPSTRKACETAGKEGRLTLTGDISCDLPNGGDRDVLRVVNIQSKCAATAVRTSGVGAGSEADSLEKSLSGSGTVDVYSIYFSFNSEEIREESEPTLAEIADVLRKHRDWKLRIAGHTDGIGNDENNLDLSKRRSSAVKDALVKRYKIEAARLSTTGFGKSQPKDTNETLDGRAHNRRVELMRIP